MSRLLFLSRWFPFPVDNGSKIRIANLLRGLATRYDITLLSFTDARDAPPDLATAKNFCREVHTVAWKPYDPQHQRARLGFLNLTPRSIVDTFLPAMQQCITQLLAVEQFDAIIASQLDTAAYAPFFRGTPALFEEVELGFLYEQFARAISFRNRVRFGLTWAKHRRYVARVLREFRACTVVSAREQQLVQIVAPKQIVQVIPNAIHLNEYARVRAPVEPNTLIFTGSFRYFANHEAMIWFVREVLPRVQTRVPDVRVTITGDHANLALPPAPNVHLTGFVENVRPLIASAWASIAPLQQGGGTRLKILEALALQTPVVATSKGAEGLDARHDEHLLIADAPDEFANQVVRLLQDPALRQRLAANGARLVSEQYDWANVMPRFLNLVEQIIS
jgi:glycosyltransferase involved in cell wall biosynthesis